MISNNRTLGIDQSYNSTGIVILENDKLIYTEKFSSNTSFNRFGQAYEITLHIAAIIDDFKPNIVAIEGLAFGMKGNVTRDLGGLQYVIVSHLQEVKKQQVQIIAPLAVKKFATGDGKANKNKMIENLPNCILESFLQLGVKKTTGLADLADAYWIAKTANNINSLEE